MNLPQKQDSDTVLTATDEEVRYVLAAVLELFNLEVVIEAHPTRDKIIFAAQEIR